MTGVGKLGPQICGARSSPDDITRIKRGHRRHVLASAAFTLPGLNGTERRIKLYQRDRRFDIRES